MTKFRLPLTKAQTAERVNTWHTEWKNGNNEACLATALGITPEQNAQYLAGDFKYIDEE